MGFPTLSGINDSVGVRGGSAQIRTAAINAALNGANTIIAGTAAAGGVPAKIIRVLSYVLVCTTPVSVTWESGDGTVLAGPMPFGATGGAAPPFNPLGHFDTLPGQALLLYLSSGVQVGGHITYLITA